MPGRPEFSQAVRGSSGSPIATNASGTVETNNYVNGGTFTVGNGTNTYPHTVNPAALIEEWVITETGNDIRVDLVTADGTAINGLHLRGAAVAMDFLSIDSITFNDPNATGAATFGMWSGE